MKNQLIILAAIALLTLSGCGSSTNSSSPTDTTSASEMAAAAASGGYNITTSTGSQASHEVRPPKTFLEKVPSLFNLFDKAFASTACPTIQSGGSGCSSTNLAETLTYSSCSFGSSLATWTGTQNISLTSPSSGFSTTCAMPTFTNGSGLTRTWATGTTRTSANGIAVTLDTSGGTSGWSTPVSTTGLSVAFTGAVARSITIGGIHTTGYYGRFKVFDHTISSTALSVSAGGVMNGTVTVQHNIALYTATATLNSLTWTAGCCYPTGGSVTTSISNGTSETLVFSSTCGVATLGGASISLNQCF